MRIATFTKANALALLIMAAGLSLTVIWGLRQLETPYQLFERYYDLNREVTQTSSKLISRYLDTGNALDLSAAEMHLQGLIDTRLNTLPATVREQVTPAALALLQDMQTRLRAAGKLAGDGQGLLLQNEREFNDLLESLSDYAEKGYASEPELAFSYLKLVAGLAQLQHDRTLLRERFFASGQQSLRESLELTSTEITNRARELLELPRFGIYEQPDPDEAFFADEDEKPAEKGDELADELNYLAQRYPAELERTARLDKTRKSSHDRVNRLASELEQKILDSKAFVMARKAAIEHQVEFWLAVFIGLIFIVGLAGTIIQLRIVNAISRLMRYLQDLRQGDLSSAFSGKRSYAEINDLTNSATHLRDHILAFIQETRARTQQLNQSSEKIETVSGHIGDLSHYLHEATCNTAQTVQQLAASFSQVARNASQASQSAAEGKQIVQASDQEMGRLSEVMETLGQAAEQGGHVMQQLQQDSRNIQDILDVIEEVAEQTTLLSLNAAIESARAGEVGRGFAVVADEVRQLAHRTTESTRQIKEQIDRLLASSQDANRVMENQQQGIRQSIEHTRDVKASLREVSRSIVAINDMNAMIAAATEEQAAASNEISDNINRMTQVSEQASEQARDARQQSHALNQISRQLSMLANKFRL